MYEKYLEEFLKTGIPTEKKTYENLSNKLEDIDKFITEWNNDNLEDFLLSLDSISVNTVNKYLQFIREFYRYVCRESGIEPKNLDLTKDVKFYIDKNRFLELTLTEGQYKYIKNELLVNTPKGLYNYRDKVLFCLAWEGLTNSDIKNLRIDDIVFYKEFGISKAKIRLRKEGRNIVIDNEELIEDLKMAIEQKEYYRVEEKREYFVNLKDTPMLIKAVAMRQNNKDEVTNPSILLNRVLMKIDGILDQKVNGVFFRKDLRTMSIEHIVRSRRVNLFIEGFSINDIKNIFGIKAENNLYWLYEMAMLIRRNEWRFRKDE